MENKNKIFEMILYDHFSQKQGVVPNYLNDMIDLLIEFYISQKKTRGYGSL